MVSKIILKGITLTACILLSTAHAVTEGFYMGIMGGPATNNGGQQNIQVLPLPTATDRRARFAAANPESSQFASRVYLGYKFSCLAGWELGFIYFSGINYKLKVTTTPPQVPAAGTTFRVRGIDLVGKLDYTIANTIGAFVKFGVVALYTTTPGALNITNYHTITHFSRAKPNQPPGIQVVNVGSNTYATKLAPTYSAGIQYDLNQNWVADLSMNVYRTGGIISQVTMYALGISYHFVDRYCGQFLCDD